MLKFTVIDKRLNSSPMALRLSALCSAVSVARLSWMRKRVEIWEYSPYNVGVWFSIDPSIDKSPAAREQLVEDLKADLARTFEQFGRRIS